MCACYVTHLCVWHDSLVLQHAHDCWPRDRGAYIHMCNVKYCGAWVHVWRDSFVSETWLICGCDVTDSCLSTFTTADREMWCVYLCVTWLICACDMTHLCVWHDSFVRVTWLICACDMTHLCVWHDSFVRVTWLIVRVTWLICACHVTHQYLNTFTNCWQRDSSACIHVQYDLFVCVTWPTYILTRSRQRTARSWCVYTCVIWLIYACDMTHLCVWSDSPIYLITLTTANREIAVHTYMRDVKYRGAWIRMRHDSFVNVTWLICGCDVGVMSLYFLS